MNLETYLQRKKQLEAEPNRFRQLCFRCFQPDFGCYCAQVSRFDPLIKFVILIHPIEFRRRIATGRMSHLCLEGSELIKGEDFSQNLAVNRVLSDPRYESVMLYPGAQALDLSMASSQQIESLAARNKKLAIFVIDGTWATARRMVRLSTNLASLRRICFTPSRPSAFRVRKQPAPGCFSTIEAIHESIGLLSPLTGFDTQGRTHDGLLTVFDYMVERQLLHVERSKANPRRAYTCRHYKAEAQ